jgi:hypothetical protein
MAVSVPGRSRLIDIQPCSNGFDPDSANIALPSGENQVICPCCFRIFHMPACEKNVWTSENRNSSGFPRFPARKCA